MQTTINRNFNLQYTSMSKKKHRKSEPKTKFHGDKKLKSGLFHLVRKLFQNHPEATLNYKDVCSLLHVKDAETRKVIVTVLVELANEGTIRQNGFQAYQLNNNLDIVEGELQLTQRGSGFVFIAKGEKDIFIPPHFLGQAIGGDIVKVAITKDSGDRREGRITEVVSRERTQFVGTIQVKDQQGFLLPDNNKTGLKISIPKEKLNGAKTGDKALVKITVWPKSAEIPFGEVVQTLGGNSLHDNEMISILVSNGLDIEFDDAVMSEAELLSLELDQNEIARRREFP